VLIPIIVSWVYRKDKQKGAVGKPYLPGLGKQRLPLIFSVYNFSICGILFTEIESILLFAVLFVRRFE